MELVPLESFNNIPQITKFKIEKMSSSIRLMMIIIFLDQFWLTWNPGYSLLYFRSSIPFKMDPMPSFIIQKIFWFLKKEEELEIVGPVATLKDKNFKMNCLTWLIEKLMVQSHLKDSWFCTQLLVELEVDWEVSSSKNWAINSLRNWSQLTQFFPINLNKLQMWWFNLTTLSWP